MCYSSRVARVEVEVGRVVTLAPLGSTVALAFTLCQRGDSKRMQPEADAPSAAVAAPWRANLLSLDSQSTAPRRDCSPSN